MKGKLYGIGIGPGDPELLTLKAVKILGSVHVVAVPESKTEKGSFALEIVKPYLKEDSEQLVLTFPMIKEKEKKREYRAENAHRIKQIIDNGKDVAFLTIGDPMLYSTYIYLFEFLKDADIEIETIPGISAFSAIASAINLPLVKQNQNLAVISMNKKTDINALLDKFDNLIIMKASVDNKRLADELKRFKDLNITIASKIGTSEEMISYDLNDLYDDIAYLTTVIVKRERN